MYKLLNGKVVLLLLSIFYEAFSYDDLICSDGNSGTKQNKHFYQEVLTQSFELVYFLNIYSDIATALITTTQNNFVRV